MKNSSLARLRATFDRHRIVLHSPLAQRWGFLPLLFAAPPLLYILLDVDPIMLSGGDSPMYVGYTQNLPDLITRYGLPYYSVRFGLILPGWIAFKLFGAVGGHFVLRYGLSVVAAGSLYLLGRRHGSRAAGWYGALMCLTSPILLRALSTTYSDTTGVPFLIAGFACVVMPSPRRVWWGLAGGLFLGLAVNSHPFVAAVVVSGVVSLLALECVRRNFRFTWSVAAIGIGILTITVAGVLFYRFAFGVSGVIDSSIKWARANSADAAKAARAPTLAWTGFSIHLYIPVVVGAAAVALGLTLPSVDETSRLRRLLGSPLADGLAMLLGVSAFYIFHQFVLKQYGLEYYFYASYLFSFVAISLTLIMVVVLRRWTGSQGLGWAFVALAVLVPLARNAFFDGLQLWALPTIPLMVVAIVFAQLIAIRHAGGVGAGPAALTISVALLGLCPPRDVPWSPGQTIRADAHYELAEGYGSTVQYDLFRLASQLMEATPKWSDDPGSVIFWYRSDSFVANTIQGTYGWVGATIHYANPGMPNLTDGERAVLIGRTPRSIVLLGDDEAELQRGRDALTSIGLAPTGDTIQPLSSGGITVYMEHLTFDAAPCDQEWRNIQFAWQAMPPSCP